MTIAQLLLSRRKLNCRLKFGHLEEGVTKTILLTSENYSELDRYDWNDVLISNNPNKQWNIMLQRFIDVADKICPIQD